MKKTDLHKIVREAIKEVLGEADISSAEKAAKDAELNAINKKIAALNVKKGDLASGREEVAEGEIDELANVPKEKKTKQGYLKDGFVVDSSETEDEGDIAEDDDELEEEDEDETEESEEQDGDIVIEDIGSELSEESYL